VAVTEASHDVNYQYENTTITYQATPPTIALDGKLSGSKWQILPFVSIAKYSVQAPTTTAGENYMLHIQAGSTTLENSLGSLAPQQKTTVYRPEFGLAAIRSETIEFNQNGQTALILATTKVGLMNWPMWLVLAALAGIIIWKLVQLRPKKRKTSSQTEPKTIPTMNVGSEAETVSNDKKPTKPPSK
jgi:hypothetical protein